MSLRERKRKNTLENIILSARGLFFNRGYRETTMNDIAGASDVAVGTLYNYFRSKGEIMLAITSQDAADLFVPSSSSEIDAMDVEGLIRQYSDKLISFISVYPRELMKELMGVFWEKGQEELSNGLVSIDMQIITQITQMLGALKESGRIKEETEPQLVALSLYGMATTAVMWYSVHPDMTLDRTRETIAAMFGHFCRGILPDGGS
ncbi:MAG: TetR/AcrR family transcriptional regulator [Candidatus Fermentibacteria bacterium]|nr:TetR/AcrR family transcriptional regulator [Candidatus Fermentibacteria bacterium]